jgi:hypothetical protein
MYLSASEGKLLGDCKDLPFIKVAQYGYHGVAPVSKLEVAEGI